MEIGVDIEQNERFKKKSKHFLERVYTKNELLYASKFKNSYEQFCSMWCVKEAVVSKEFPIQYGINSNYCLTHTTTKPKNRDAIIEEIANNGYEVAAKKYFGCSLVHKMYWLIPPKARNLIRKMRGN